VLAPWPKTSHLPPPALLTNNPPSSPSSPPSSLLIKTTPHTTPTHPRYTQLHHRNPVLPSTLTTTLFLHLHQRQRQRQLPTLPAPYEQRLLGLVSSRQRPITPKEADLPRPLQQSPHHLVNGYVCVLCISHPTPTTSDTSRLSSCNHFAYRENLVAPTSVATANTRRPPPPQPYRMFP